MPDVEYGGTDPDVADSGGSAASAAGSGSGGGKWKDSGTAKGLKAGGSNLAAYGKQASENADSLASANPGVRSYRKGGKVRKTGLIHAHRGEEVVRPEEADKVRRFLKREKNNRGEEVDDVRESQRKADPRKTERKYEPKRAMKKEDPKRTSRLNSPKRKLGTRKAKRGKGREM